MSARKLAEQEKNLADLKSELEETKKATPSDEVGKVVIQVTYFIHLSITTHKLLCNHIYIYMYNLFLLVCKQMNSSCFIFCLDIKRRYMYTLFYEIYI